MVVSSIWGAVAWAANLEYLMRMVSETLYGQINSMFRFWFLLSLCLLIGQPVSAKDSSEIEKLIAQTQDRSLTRQQRWAASAELGKRGEEAIPLILQSLKMNSHWSSTFCLIMALQDMKARAAPAVPSLINLLDDKHKSVASLAAQALGDIGESARPAIPKLVEKLNSPEPLVRLRAAEALLSLNSTNDKNSSLSVLNDLAKQKDNETAERARDVLNRFKKK